MSILCYFASLSKNYRWMQFYIWFFIIGISALNVLHIFITSGTRSWYLWTFLIFIIFIIFAWMMNARSFEISFEIGAIRSAMRGTSKQPNLGFFNFKSKLNDIDSFFDSIFSGFPYFLRTPFLTNIIMDAIKPASSSGLTSPRTSPIFLFSKPLLCRHNKMQSW